MKKRLHVLAIGGPHQFPHILPVGFELFARGNLDVRIFVLEAQAADAVRAFAKSLDQRTPPVEILTSSRYTSLPGIGVSKLLTIVGSTRRLRNADALLAAERTSTILKRLPGPCPMFIHILHGAGDRAKGFERRISLFDHVLTAGEKDKARIVKAKLQPEDRVHAVGGVKLAAVGGAGALRTQLFDNARPTLLFNPHFSKALGSFDRFAERLIDACLADGRYNLIVAPHYRLAKNWKPKKVRSWEDRSVPGQIIVDLGSLHSTDMTYVLNSDFYIGDVSSQVYEFITDPRPCLFIDTNAADWHGNPDFAMWNFGHVIAPDYDPIAAIDRSFADFEKFRPVQQGALAQAFSAPDDGIDAVERAANMIEKIMMAKMPSSDR